MDKLDPFAVVFGPLSQSRRVTDALSRAGWRVARDSGCAGAMLVVHDADGLSDPAELIGGDDDAFARMGVGDPAAAGRHDDARITGEEPVEELVALFARWLPPGCEELDRMANAFGRAELAPLVENVLGELRTALAALDDGAVPDAHKLAGLTGTVGFLDASRAWQALDEQGGPDDSARRATRMAIVTISRWLAG